MTIWNLDVAWPCEFVYTMKIVYQPKGFSKKIRMDPSDVHTTEIHLKFSFVERPLKLEFPHYERF